MKTDHEQLIGMYREQGLDAHSAYNQYLKDILPSGHPPLLGLKDVLRIYAEDKNGYTRAAEGAIRFPVHCGGPAVEFEVRRRPSP